MRSILVLLEDLVHHEFGARDLAVVRTLAAAQLARPDRVPGAGGRVMAFVTAIADVRRRPVTDMYQFVAYKLMPQVLKAHHDSLADCTSARAVLLQFTRLAPVVLDALVPGLPDAEFDVELVDLDTLRMRFEGPEEMLAVLEGATLGVVGQFGEKAAMARVAPPAFAPTRRLLDVRVAGERR